MHGHGNERVVTGTSGQVYHELRVDVHPKVSVETAQQLALRVFSPAARRGATTQDAGLVVLPNGRGVLTRVIRVTATQGTGSNTVRDVYVDAHTGMIRLNQSAVRFSGIGPAAPLPMAPTQPGGPDAAPTSPPTTSPSPPVPSPSPPKPTGSATSSTPAPAAGDVIKTTGKNTRGESIPIVVKGEPGHYALIDDSRRKLDPAGSSVQTYDARGIEWSNLVKTMPTEVQPFVTKMIPVEGEASEFGAVDAHWGAAQVVDFYRNKFGRNGLDGRGSPVISAVGAVGLHGAPFINAFWDGTKMVYGGKGDGYRPLSSSLDIVGHEMTHGVSSHTARFIYHGQSGALDEAFADYFGNAIQLSVKKIDMNAPNSGLIGEDSCFSLAPQKCAVRDLDEVRTTHDHFLGTGEDHGGVHVNATIPGGALWEIRKKLPTDVADSIVYAAMTQYLAPLSNFVDARRAVSRPPSRSRSPRKTYRPSTQPSTDVESLRVGRRSWGWTLASSTST
ncbi:M4 family metallopeptidase [Austwickia chelonae]|uniref:M4 family metallopeptidase n=1 Tax=Austwickia chelonae TaxID=100225 RepID=UPI000E25842C|nr:M4 family metallopeptidase [Austwickia chelonae]